jgi:hypothetical protein
MYGVLLDRSPIFHNLHCSNIQLLIYLLTRMFFLVYGINIHLFLSWLKMSSSPVSATLLASRGCMVVACLALIGATGGSSNQMFHLIIQYRFFFFSILKLPKPFLCNLYAGYNWASLLLLFQFLEIIICFCILKMFFLKKNYFFLN